MTFCLSLKTGLRKIQSYQKEEEGLKLDVHLVADKNIFIQNTGECGAED